MSDAVQHLVQRMVYAQKPVKKKKAKYENLAHIHSGFIKRFGSEWMEVDPATAFIQIDFDALLEAGLIDMRECIAGKNLQATLFMRAMEKALPSVKPIDSQAADKSQKLQLTWKK